MVVTLITRVGAPQAIHPDPFTTGQKMSSKVLRSCAFVRQAWITVLQAPEPIQLSTNTWVSITARMAIGIKNATIYAVLSWCLDLSTADRPAYSQRTFKVRKN